MTISTLELSLYISLKQDDPSNKLIRIKCSVCLIFFNGGERRPRGFPCGHSFCTSCISDGIINNKVVCYFCKTSFEATSASNFSINYALDNLINGREPSDDHKQTEVLVNCGKSLKAPSKRLKSQIDAVVAEVEDLSSKNSSVRSQLQKYAVLITDKKSCHEAFISLLQDMVQRSNKELSKVQEALDKGTRLITDLEQAKHSLKTAVSRDDILQLLEEVDLRCESLEGWIEATSGSFPNKELVTQSQEVSRSSKIIEGYAVSQRRSNLMFWLLCNICNHTILQ